MSIEDSTGVPGLPTDLVERYGIRAYVGFPWRVAGKAVAESQSLMSLSEQFAAGRLTFEEFQRGLGALAAMAGKLEQER